jgi:hypothetical protein
VGCVGEPAPAESNETVWIERIQQGVERTPPSAAAGHVATDLLPAEPATAHNLHGLIADRYPDTIGLPDLIRKLKDNEQGRAFVGQFVGLLKQSLGVELNPADVEAAMDKPEVFLDLLQFSPQQLAAGRDILLDVLAQTGGPGGDLPLPAMLKSEYQLGASLNYESIDAHPFQVPPDELVPVVDGVYLGVVRDRRIPADQMRENFIFAEVVERLGMNIRASEEDKFSVEYEGQRYARLPDFLQGLLDTGHEMKAFVRHYVAPFVPMYAVGPDSNLHPVAATVFLRTGFKDAQGVEAALPLFHSELVFSVKPGPGTPGQGVHATVQYYQGIPKTGFYGEGNMERPRWLGEVVTDDAFSTNEAAVALLLGGYMVDVTRAIAEKHDILFDGWGVTGVCNDSAAVLQQSVHGKVTSYPLFMRDDMMLAELEERFAPTHRGRNARLDQLAYRILAQSIRNTPEDMSPTPSALQRLRLSFPWQRGQEPFYSAQDARRIVDEQP